MDIKIKEHDGCVSLYLEVLMKPGPKRYKPIDAIGWLEERGYKLGECVKKDIVYNLTEREKLLKGHWTFKVSKSPLAAPPVVPTKPVVTNSAVPKKAPTKKVLKKSYTRSKPNLPAEDKTTEE